MLCPEVPCDDSSDHQQAFPEDTVPVVVGGPAHAVDSHINSCCPQGARRQEAHGHCSQVVAKV